ncbi:TPA: hypothetical protein N2N30_005536, partial [Escherichia coli]|nr:hypothetical protein [Klebsiella pneumoniae]HCC6475656.1 hypothetical protein [Escherichia coli]HCL5524060.1 hypothetical protein [Escherichia coli]HCL5529335.1 hypothetical protein [Escherichia coli]HDE2841325.1 hypothetical protein [Klebsiella pneumoniae]
DKFITTDYLQQCHLNQADQHYLNQVAMSLNTRPRKALDWLTPLEKFAQLVDYHMAFETVAPHV